MDRYQVTDPKGVLVGKEIVAKGKLLPPGHTGSQLKAWLRFGQIAKIEAPKPAPPPGKPPENSPEGNKPPENPTQLPAK